MTTELVRGQGGDFPSTPPFRVYAGIFLASAAALLFEISLTRVFAYTIWYHFAYLTIALAMLGIGAGGSFYAALQGHPRSRAVLGPDLLSAAAALSVLALVLELAVPPPDPFTILADSRVVLRFVEYSLLAGLPFFFFGTLIASTFAQYPAYVGRVYSADLIGASLGCVLLPPLLPAVGGTGILLFSAMLFGAGAIALLSGRKSTLALLVLAIAVTGATRPWDLEFRPCASKLYHYFVADPDTDILYSRWTAIFRTEVYKTVPGPMAERSGYNEKGCGRSYAGPKADLTYIGHDAGACAVMMTFPTRDDQDRFFRENILAIPYRLRPNASVAIGGVGGGVDIMAALANGATSVLGIELDPSTRDAVVSDFAALTLGTMNDPRVAIRVGDARSVIRRSPVTFDVISFTGVDTVTAVAAGAQLLAESYLYTTEAMHDYFDHLNPNGALCFTNADSNSPPRIAPRLAATMARALAQRGVSDPGRHILVTASGEQGGRISVMAKETPYSEDEIRQYREFIDRNGFTSWHCPGMSPGTWISEYLGKLPADRERMLAESALALSPATDDQPFFFNFYRWTSAADYWNDPARNTPGFIGPIGNIVMALSFLLVLLLGVVLVLAPAFLATRRLRKEQWASAFAPLGYFAAIGLGFMLIEIPMLQHLVLFLGYPTYSLSVTLVTLLAFSGLGSLASQRPDGPATGTVNRLLAGLLVYACLYAVFATPIYLAFALFPIAARIAIAVVVLAPAGLMLGMFLPLGMRSLGRLCPEAIPLAWAFNGFFSVTGTYVALFSSMQFGFRATFCLATLAYLFAAYVYRRSMSGTAGTIRPRTANTILGR